MYATRKYLIISISTDIASGAVVYDLLGDTAAAVVAVSIGVVRCIAGAADSLCDGHRADEISIGLAKKSQSKISAVDRGEIGIISRDDIIGSGVCLMFDRGDGITT